MKKIIFMTIVLLLSRESSASLMQLTYNNFYAPPSPTNYPVDRSGVVSFTFDDAVADTDPSAISGTFANPIKSGFMFLSGVQYQLDFNAPSEMTSYAAGMSNLQATGSIVNQQLGSVRSFFLYFGGSLSATAGESLQNIINECYELHLIVFDPNAVVGSSEYNAAYASYENGRVSVAAATVPESSTIGLLLLGALGILVSRVRKSRAL